MNNHDKKMIILLLSLFIMHKSFMQKLPKIKMIIDVIPFKLYYVNIQGTFRVLLRKVDYLYGRKKIKERICKVIRWNCF